MLTELNVTTMLNFTTAPPVGGCPPVGIQLEGLLLPPVLTIDVTLGLLGNAVALWIFCFKVKKWNPNTLFLFNLVIADFLALVSLPLRIHSLLVGHWVFGDAMCRINLFLMFSNRSASIALMTVVAIYRYFKVVHPHHRVNLMTRRQAAFVSLIVWFLESSRSILILLKMHRILTVLEFFLPAAILLFCSVRIHSFLRGRQIGNPEKVRKAMRVCVAIVLVFTLCFLPTTLSTLGLWFITSFRPWDCASFYSFTQITIVSLGISFLNSALDPVVYVFSSSTFRRALCGSLPRSLRCCGGEKEAPS
ncbi:Hydroxycarboxylic acid receptor 2 [Dissostichus eleginoides]|uniref:Hydroxycarboxylic acid receptor 2 n=1 Tax=Dissostichus eleginoides TaxID=100907 RepID=A0AAD9BD89_DISEL|nr:Hydroxycarboxylic acid receptor 2 [Dissostichus eleginoides]